VKPHEWFPWLVAGGPIAVISLCLLAVSVRWLFHVTLGSLFRAMTPPHLKHPEAWLGEAQSDLFTGDPVFVRDDGAVIPLPEDMEWPRPTGIIIGNFDRYERVPKAAVIVPAPIEGHGDAFPASLLRLPKPKSESEL
jgi:hypothetical protein